jgi:hypothetical protein
MPLRALLAALALAALALAALSQPARAEEPGLIFEETPLSVPIPKPQIEIVLLRQDVTDRVTIAIQQAPLLPKVEKAVAQPAFETPAQ